ncbi:hypothetical protein ABPG74_022699 [Tetrahymena malaccensis]
MNSADSEQKDFNTQKNDIFSVDNNSVQTPMNKNPLQQDSNAFTEKSKKSNISLLKIDRQAEQDYIDEIQDVSMSVVINRKLYTYIGKPHPEILQLFELLKEKSVQKSNFRIINYLRQKLEDLEEWFDNKCVFFGGRMKISLYESIMYLFFIIIYIVYAVRMSQIGDDIKVRSSVWKSEFSGNSIWFGAVFTIYGILYINIKSVLILFLLFIALVVVQVLLLLYDFNILTNGISGFQMVSYSTLYSRIYPIILYVHWFIFSLVYNWIKNSFKRSSSMFLGIGWCLLIPYFVCLQVMSYLLLQQNYSSFDVINNILNILIAPFIIIVIVSWIILHYRLFMLPVSNITIAIARIKEEINKNFKQPIPIEENDEEDPQNKKLRSKWKRFKKFVRVHFYMISSIVIGSIYCFCEIFLVYQVINEFSSSTINYDNLAVLLFQIIIIPAFIVLGIVISVSKRQTWTTFTFFPLFVAAFPLFAIIPLSSLLQKTSFGGNIQYVAIIALPTCIIYWLILAMFGVQRRFHFLFFITYTCIFFAFPIGFLLPLSYISISGLDASKVYFISGLIVAAGIGLVLIYFIYFIIKFLYQNVFQRKSKKIIDLTAISYFNLKNMGFLVNSSGFILGYTLLCYVFYARPSTASNDDRGFVDAMLINLPVMFVLINYALQVESLEQVVEDDSVSLDASVNQSYSMNQSQQSKLQQSQIIEDQEIQQKLSFQKRLIYVGIIVPFVTCLPLFILSTQRQNTTRTAVIMIGMPFCFLLLWFLLEVKNRSKMLQNFFTPFLATICWCCVILPLLVIAPVVANYIETEGAYFADFMRSIIAAVAVILICGVTSFSIFIFVIKNKLAEEKKKKFVITQMLKMCIDNRVKVKINALGVLYDIFHKKHQQETLMKFQLQDKQDPLRYNYSQKPKDKNFEEEIVIFNKRKIKNETKSNQEKKKTKLDICLDYLFCRFGIQVDSLNQEENSELTMDELVNEVERAEQIMDDYLPKQIRVGYLYNKYNQNRGQGDEEQANLMELIEQTKEQKAIQLFENPKLKVKSKHEQISSKTQLYRSYKVKRIKAADLNKFKYTDYSQLIYNSEFERGFFFHDLYKDFANEDDNQPELMIYNDFLELCRLSGILQVDDDYASSLKSEIPSLKDKQDSIPSDLQSFDEINQDQLTQKELSQIYDSHSSQVWKGGILALNLQDFSKCMIDIANKLSINKDSTTVSLKLRELLYERMFGYLMTNIPGFASNYRPDVRKFMKKEEMDKRMEGSPFIFTIPLKTQIEDDEEIIFNYQKKNRLFLSMQKEENLNYENIQRMDINEIKGSNKNKVKVQDINTTTKVKENVTCFIMMCRCLRTCCCVYPSKAFSYVDKKISSLIQRLSKPKIAKNVISRKPKTKKAPSWNDMADNLVTTMVNSIKAYEENQNQAQKVQFNLNINNLMVIVGKLSDFLTLYGVAFNNQVEWLPGYSTKVDTAQVTSGTVISAYYVLFWLCVGLGILYFFIALIAQDYAEEGTLGKDENGENASFRHKQFYLSKGVNIIGATLFMFIMKTLIDAYICDWETSAPWNLYRTNTIVCLSNTHFWMMACGFIALLGYYPLSTFIQPSIQFLDHTLDVKYDKSYIAVYIQAKLIVLGATSFFNSFQNKTLISMIQLSVTSFVGFGMSLLAIKIEPCLIGFINPIETACLLSIGVINGIGLLIVITKQSLILFIVNIVLHLILIVIVAIILKKKYFSSKNQPKKLFLNHLPVIQKTQQKKKELDQLKVGVDSPQQTPQVSRRQNKITSKDVSESFQTGSNMKNKIILDAQSDAANSKILEIEQL